MRCYPRASGTPGDVRDGPRDDRAAPRAADARVAPGAASSTSAASARSGRRCSPSARGGSSTGATTPDVPTPTRRRGLTPARSPSWRAARPTGVARAGGPRLRLPPHARRREPGQRAASTRSTRGAWWCSTRRSAKRPVSLVTDLGRLRARIDSLRTMAENTDGLAIVNSNDIDRGLRRVVDDLTSYYLLGYYSTNRSWTAGSARSRCKVKRSGRGRARPPRLPRGHARPRLRRWPPRQGGRRDRDVRVTGGGRGVEPLKVRADAMVQAQAGYVWAPARAARYAGDLAGRGVGPRGRVARRAVEGGGGAWPSRSRLPTRRASRTRSRP